MKKHWPKWSRNIGVRVILLFVLMSVTRPSLLLATSHDLSSQAGTNLGNWVLDRMGSTQGIQDRSANPLTNNSTQLKSLDDATSFDAQLTCPSSSAFLNVTTGVTAINKDLDPIVIAIDTDLDGTADYTYSPPSPVSGVCANGVISCDPGTWNSCNYYQWQTSAAINVTLSATSMTALGGCYCVNASCGSPSATMLSKILQDLGSGVAASIQSVDPKYAISNVSVSGFSIDYYGQNTAACSSIPSSSGPTNPDQYYGNPSAITTDTTTEITSQSGDPDSYYNLMSSSLASSAAASAYPTCKVDRVISVTTTTDTVTNSGAGTMCTDHFVYVRVFEADPLTFHLQVLDTGPGELGEPHKNCGGGGSGGGVGDWHTLEIITLPAAPTSFWATINASGGGCGTTPTSTVSTVNTPLNVITCSAGGAQFPSYTYSYFFNYTLDTINEVINDGCTGLEADPTCQLKDETVDGVITYANYNPTGLTPLNSCRDFAGGLGNYTECRDWWEQDRTYRCETGATYDFSDAQTRAEAITGSVSSSPTSLYYEDLRKDEGGAWVSDNSTFTLPSATPTGTCDMSCRTSKPTSDTDATLSGNTSEFRLSTNSIDTFYKTCPIVGGTPTCPLDIGETLVSDCACQDDFAEAASMMEVLKTAGEEMSCNGVTDPSTGLCTGTIEIFGGKGASCRPSGADTTFFNCCSNTSSSILDFLKFCDASEQELNDARDNGQTVLIGSQCISSIDLGFTTICIQDEEVYCQFSGKLGRIIHEQGRPQLNTFGTTGDWGTVADPKCGGFTPEDFAMLDFSQIDLSDYFGDISTENQSQMETNMGDEINNFYNDLR